MIFEPGDLDRFGHYLRAVMLDKKILAMLSGLLLLSCGDDAAPEGGVLAENSSGSAAVAGQNLPGPLGLTPWYRDFPGAPEAPAMSPSAARSWYDKSRRQATKKVVANLQGNCSKAAWRMARAYFERAAVEELPLLIEQMDRAAQNPDDAVIVANTVEAMGRAGNPMFADAILRAINHSSENVRFKAMEALIYSGDKDAVLRVGSLFRSLPQRSQLYWLRAARRHLGREVVAWYRDIISTPALTPLHATIIDESERLSAELAAEVFRPLWENPLPSMRPHIAVLLHANGEASGTMAIAEYLRSGSGEEKMITLHSLLNRDSTAFIDQLLQLSSDPDPRVRSMLVELFRNLDDQRVDATLETMAVMEDMIGVRHNILGILVEHGRRGHLQELIGTIRKGTGSKLRMAITDVVAAKDGQAVAALDERMQKVPPAERRALLQAIGHISKPQSLAPLQRVFLADEEIFPGSQSYAVVLMMNARGAEAETMQLMDALPKSDYRRRAQLLGVLASIAADREDPHLRDQVYTRFRAILTDDEEIPQIRLLALERLRRDLSIADAMKIKRMLTEEAAPMRRALNNFLFEFF